MRLLLTLMIFLLLFCESNQAQDAFFAEADAFFKKYVQKDGLVDYQAIHESGDLLPLVDRIATYDPLADQASRFVNFYINAYNLLVIKGVIDHYPINSVQDVAGFFDRKRYVVAGQSLTLNELERDILANVHYDARLHFVLVCGAKGCPPLIPEAYSPDKKGNQLDRQVSIAVNDPVFLRIDHEAKTIGLSQIFRWYADHFGGSRKQIIDFINTYRETPLPEDYRFEYYTYDWTLNTQEVQGNTATNAARYIVSSTIPKGNTETKIFNNLYSERTRNAMGELSTQSTFFTNINSFLYGVSHRLNLGFELRYRRVRYGNNEDTPFTVFSEATRQGVTTLGPKVRFAPVPRWTNFSIQSALWFPLGDDLAGRTGEERFIDWEGPTWWTQFFNDFPIGTRFSLFTEVDVLWEDIGSSDKGRQNRLSTPATVIFSYFPTPQATVYTLGNYSPFWQDDFDYFMQAGLGSKYQFTPDLELELSYTWFSNQFLQENNGLAATYNLGIRFNL